MACDSTHNSSVGEWACGSGLELWQLSTQPSTLCSSREAPTAGACCPRGGGAPALTPLTVENAYNPNVMHVFVVRQG